MIETNGASKELLELLMHDRVVAGQIPEAAFTGMLTACQENPAFVGVLEGLKEQGDGPFQALMLLGPQGLLALTGLLAQNKVVSRKEISTECKIKSGPKKEPVWYSEIWKALAETAYAAMQADYLENVEQFRKDWGDIVPDTLDGLFTSSGKSAMASRVNDHTHPVTEKKCALAFQVRIDVNADSRNGVKDAEKAAAKAATAENGTPAAV